MCLSEHKPDPFFGGSMMRPLLFSFGLGYNETSQKMNRIRF
ncbi:hypothetical protein HMPREF1985_01006 [Mitsuokella sp. oral taxon 131 str. W9106]|nr:hypothetical protein HMPREF1985_01006 [Mitsuokella sp. oral taxon 131 str. W9106]